MVTRMSHKAGRVVGARRGAAVVAMAVGTVFGCDSRVGGQPGTADEPTSSSEALNTSPAVNNFVLYAQRSVKIGTGDVISNGDIGVVTPAVASVGTQLAVGDFAFVDPSHNLLAPSVSLGLHSRVGDVQTTSLQNNGGSLHTLGTFPAFIMPPVPLALPSTTTGADVTVHDFEARRLTPGNYGALTIDGVALLEGGSFSFTSVQIGPGARMLAENGAVSIQIAGALSAGVNAEVAPIDAFDPFDWGHHQCTSAADLSIAVAGVDGSTGTPPAVRISDHSSVVALLVATHGTVSLGDGTTATGALAGFDVALGRDVIARFQDGFPVAPVAQHGAQQLSGYVTRTLASAPLVGPVPPSTILNIGIGLPVQDAQGLQTYIDNISDPTNSMYGQGLGVGDFATRFGSLSYPQLVAFAQANNLSIRSAFANNIYISLAGPASVIEQALYVEMNFYQRPDGTQFYALDREPSINFAPTVLRVSGLDNFTVAHTAGGSGPQGYELTDLRNAYLGAGTSCSTLVGTGQHVGLFELALTTEADLGNYGPETVGATTYLPTFHEIDVSVDDDGFTTPTQADQFEAEGDIESAYSMAPGATIDFFTAPNVGGAAVTNAVFNTMATSSPLDMQLSTSWGTDGDGNTLQVLQELAAQRQTLFVAAGDTGAYGPGTGAPAPSDIAGYSNPWATIVGGTTLFMSGAGASYLSETTWNTPCFVNTTNNGAVSCSGSGGILGGYGALDFPAVATQAIPSYQLGLINSTNNGSTTNRNVPDVSAVATGIDFYAFGANQGALGTSFASPLWAGFTALINEQASFIGHPEVGFLNPAIYRIAAAGGATYANAFNDVVSGNNNNNGLVNGYQAVPGYDLATGLGSPKAGCWLVYDLVGGTPPPSPQPDAGSTTPTVVVGATETDQGPLVCLSGAGFPAGSVVTAVFTGVPGPVSTIIEGSAMGSATVATDGSYSVVPGLDSTLDSLDPACSSAQIFSGVVTITVSGNSAGTPSVSTTMPAAYWCAGAIAGTDPIGAGCN